MVFRVGSDERKRHAESCALSHRRYPTSWLHCRLGIAEVIAEQISNGFEIGGNCHQSPQRCWSVSCRHSVTDDLDYDLSCPVERLLTSWLGPRDVSDPT